MTPDLNDFRLQARGAATHALAVLAQAVNHCDNPAVPYRFDAAAQADFEAIAQAVVRLIEGGVIQPRSVAIAQADAAFQRHLAHVVGLPAPRPVAARESSKLAQRRRRAAGDGC